MYKTDKTILGFDRITFDRQLLIGTACIRRMSITVAHIFGLLSKGVTIDEIVELYPQLEREDVQQALDYAAWLANQRVYPHRN
jgi:uncharacterized protein (DUF433 family)